MHKPATPTKRHLRTSLAAAGAALLGLSLLLTAAPALGAANHGSGGTTNGNGSNGGGGGSGNVKVHDAATGLQTSGTDNEPHVCDFWLEFDFAESHEAGAWSVVSIAPTGDGSTVASGTYDTAGDGTDASSVIVVPSGHYRVEWTATGTTTTKKKTFWVDDGCRETAPPADASPAGDRAPSDDPAPPADESPAEEPASSLDDAPASDPAPPSNESVPPPDEQLPSSVEETVVEDAAPLVDETAVDDLAPPVDETAVEDAAPLVDETAVDDLAPPVDETAVDDLVSPPDDTFVEVAAEAQDAGSTDAELPPDQDQLDGTAVVGEPTMPDTAVPARPMPGGLLGMVWLLLLTLGVDVTARRHLQAERA